MSSMEQDGNNLSDDSKEQSEPRGQVEAPTHVGPLQKCSDSGGLIINGGSGNEIVIDSDTKFSASKISIEGAGNVIHIERVLHISRLTINLKGSNKKIVIKESVRKINNLKIVSIRGEQQEVCIGKNFSCGGLEIQMNDGDERLNIGDDCLFSWGIKMRTSDGHSVIDIKSGRAINLPRDINVSNRVWVGEDVYFCKGVNILEDSIVAARSVVSKGSKCKNVVLAGNPARIVKKKIKWHRLMPRLYNDKITDSHS